MKTTFFKTLLLSAFLAPCALFAQGEKQVIPDVLLKTLDGSRVSSNTFDNEGKPMVISFWATWCKPCIQELIAMDEHYADWQEETGVKIIAISIDDARNSAKVAPFVEGRGWEYEVYIDENSDLVRALGVNNVPHTFLVNGDKKIVWDHPSYMPGDEEELYEHIKELKAEGAKE